jgi:hypothetical protein
MPGFSAMAEKHDRNNHGVIEQEADDEHLFALADS